MTRRGRATRLLALFPAGVAVGIGLAWILAPSEGPLALLSILSVHLALVCLVLLPVALSWRSAALRRSLAALLVVAIVRFSGDWVSLPPASSEADRLTVVTWNVEFGGVSPQAIVDQLTSLDADVVAIEELTSDQATAIDASAPVIDRFPYRALEPIEACSASAC